MKTNAIAERRAAPRTSETFLRELDEIRRSAADLVEGLSDAQLNWRPGPDRWSIAECLEHLSISAELYFPMIDEAVARRRAEHGEGRGSGPVSFNFLERWVLGTLEPPVRLKVRSPRIFAPPSDLDGKETITRFLSVQDELERRIRDAEGLDLRRIRVPSPVSRLVRSRLGFVFAYLVAHERRHLWQAEQVRTAPGFPAS